MAAFWEISVRLDFESAAALALPPFNPPNLPRATAAGFFSGFGAGGGGFCFEARSTTEKAVSFISLLERLGMVQICTDSEATQVESCGLAGQTVPLPADG